MPFMTSRAAPLACTLAALLLAAACTTPETEPEVLPYTPAPEPEPEAIGYFLARLDTTIRAWTNLKLAATDERSEVQRRGLERDLAYRVGRRTSEIIQQLESGPPKNRAVAAAALGFSGDPLVVSPLLAGLSDPDPEVASNALFGLGTLGFPETPLTQIAWLLRHHPDAMTRSNAAYALHGIVNAGGRSDILSKACGDALSDEIAGVRAQCASVLGLIADPEAIPALSDLLHDDVNLVWSAAASALGRIGRKELEHKGDVARRLVDALARSDDAQFETLRNEIVKLHGTDLGEELEPWREWAFRLP